MENFSPRLRNLDPFKIILPDLPVSEVWEIPGCSRSGDVMWNVIMAYLNHPPYTDADLMKRVKFIMMDDFSLEKVRVLKNCIKKYNPFLHRNTDDYDQIMNDLIQPFKNKIEMIKTTHPNLFSNSFKSYVYCQGSALILKCRILLLLQECRGNEVTIHPIVFPDIGLCITPNKWLTIFNFCVDNCEYFSFGMWKEFGFKKQMQALKEILKKTKICDVDCSCNARNSIITQISMLPNIKENFISSLVKSKLSESIPYIYKSPYVISKLRDALFEINPLVKDGDGKSALFQALIGHDASLLYFLYNQATKMSLNASGSICYSTRAVPESLIELKEIFVQMEKQVKELFSGDNDKLNVYLKRLDCISRFNEFQTEISQLLNDLVPFQVNHIDYCSSKEIFEAEQRKKAAICILKTYDKYFIAEDSASKTDNFSDFCKHNHYFTNIDYMTTVRFFDHLFLLKERLILPNSLYAMIEKQFFLFIYCKDCFEKLQSYENLSAQIVSRMILYQERLYLRRHAGSFRRNLEKVNICSGNVVKNIPEDSVQTFTNLSEIYGIFLKYRLEYYLNAAISISVTDLSSILIIERALLVVGECLKQTEIGFKTIQKVLPFVLPSELVTNLKRIRNSLSHVKPAQVLWRNSVEEEVQLFKNIQLELRTLAKIFEPVLAAQFFRTERFTLLTTLKAVRKAMNKNVMTSHIESLKEVLILYYPNSHKNNSSDFLEKWKEHFQTVKNSLRKKILSLNKECSKLDKKHACWYNYSVMNIFDLVTKTVSELEHNDKGKIDDCIWALEYILEYITIDPKAKYKRNFLKKMKLRRILFQERRNKNKRRENSSAVRKATCTENTVHENRDRNFSNFYNAQSFTENSHPDASIAVEDSIPTAENSNQVRIEDIGISEEKNSLKSSENQNSEEENRKYFKILKEKALNIVSDYKEIYTNIIRDTDFIVTVQSDTRFKHIGIFRKALAGHSFLNNKEKKKITDSIPSCFKTLHNAIFSLEGFLENQNPLTEEFLRENISKLPLQEEEKETLYKDLFNNKESALSILKKIPDYFGELRTEMEKGEIPFKKFERICGKLEIPPVEKNILKKLVIGIKPKEPGNQLLFLRNRVRLLKEILIDSDKEIKQLSVKAKSPKTKSYLFERIVERYLTDSSVKASVEMLLFDCMNLLKRKDLKDLWRKSSNLFNGIDLRNVLAHGNPLLETAGKILDPYDLPSELIRKMLVLVNDLNPIDCMLDIVEDSNADFRDFHKIMNDDENSKYLEKKKTILDCDYWKEYSILIPIGRPVSDSCN